MADDLREVLEQARRDCPEIPAHAWERIARSIRANFGASRIYVAAHHKRTHLDQLAEMDADATAEAIADKLGITVRHARRLRQLR